MPVNIQLKHTIVWCADKRKPAVFLTEILGLPDPSHLGSMLVVLTENEGSAASEHHAFLLSEEELDQVFAQVQGRRLKYRAYRQDAGRGIYFEDPDGNLLEVMTGPCSATGVERPPSAIIKTDLADDIAPGSTG
ncbi:hypothetical protein SAMN05518865_10881 [Duganella sp. CF458]|uniref:VOC family protein n=1 Tax=Duganella sp. CF458 TaxID=1884368 RepID=UPI0008E10BC9|nr:hypothetical protein SAMN05518865_10881 [Duganella sp. CF458]